MVQALFMSRRHALVLAAASFAGGAAEAQLKSGDDPEASPRWQQVRAGLFKGRTLRDNATEVITLDAPARAEDAASALARLAREAVVGAQLVDHRAADAHFLDLRAALPKSVQPFSEMCADCFGPSQ